LGADEAIDATGHDLATLLRELSDGIGFDVVIEASGAAHAPSVAGFGVRRGGRVLLVGMHAEPREIDLRRLILREVASSPRWHTSATPISQPHSNCSRRQMSQP
jgi:threonine dehydrogenase-like Zn-dependent dehydrogenase